MGSIVEQSMKIRDFSEGGVWRLDERMVSNTERTC